MHVVIAGGRGFLGGALTRRLTARGHRVSVLTRRPRSGQPGELAWNPDGDTGPWARALDGADVLVNLAGEGIADRRWSAARKQALVESRVKATSSLATALRRLSAPPRIAVNASGIGYYGPCGDEVITESAPAGHDFIARMAAAWEAAAAPMADRARLVLLRSGVVLGEGGALAQMRLPFSLGLGGRLGSGRQWMPWISLDDWTGLVMHLIVDERASGAFNVVAPETVTNAEFTRALGRAMHRPTIVPVPGFVLRLAVGEVAEALLTGQRAVPEKALALGFAFRFPAIDEAVTVALADGASTSLSTW